MKRLLALIPLAAIAALLMGASPAQAMSCSNTFIHKPWLSSGIHTSYAVQCAHGYFISINVEYETGGVFHGTNPIKDFPSDALWAANSSHADSDVAFSGVTGVNGSIAPYCQYNLRMDLVLWPNPHDTDAVEVHSPILSKTC